MLFFHYEFRRHRRRFAQYCLFDLWSRERVDHRIMTGAHLRDFFVIKKVGLKNKYNARVVKDENKMRKIIIVS